MAYTFYSQGLFCSGQIIGKVGERLLVEGLALDSGAYFLRLGDEMRRFASRKEAEDYGAELAQDAAGKSKKLNTDGKIAMDPLTDEGEKIKSSMEKQYGKEKGEKVFYASANKGTITGVH